MTPVYDAVSMFVPDLSLSLPQIMAQFAYIGSERLSEVVNRGYNGDEDSDGDGTTLQDLDFAEVHDRLMDKFVQIQSQNVSESAETSEVIDEPTESVEDEEG